MPDETLLMEILRRIQADTAETRREVSSIKVRMSALTHHVRGIMTTLGGIQSDITDLSARVDRIERRLDIVDA